MSSTKIESGLELISRLNQRPTLENLNPALLTDGPFPNEFIEIIGGSGLGKTTLLMDFMKRSLLHSNLGGKNCGVILINTDHHFDLFRFIGIIEDDLKLVPKSQVEGVIKSCLSNFIILNCYDIHQLQMTFYNLERLLLENPNIGLVSVDSLRSFYWQYRSINGPISKHAYHKKLLKTLEDNVRNLSVVVFYTLSGVTNEVFPQEVSRRIELREENGKLYAIVHQGDMKKISYTLDRTIRFIV